MTKQAGAFGGQTGAVAGAIAVVAAVAGAYFLGYFDKKPPVPATEPVPVAQPVAPAEKPAPEASSEAAPAEPASPEPVVAEPVIHAAPRFDLVRVEPDGSTLVAGSAVAGAELDILLDGALLVQAVLGTDGKFASFVTIAPSDQPRVLGLLMRVDGQEIPSDETVIIAPVVQVAAAAPEKQTEKQPEADTEQPRQDTQPAPAKVVDEAQPKQDEPAQPASSQPEQPVVVAASEPKAEEPEAQQPKAAEAKPEQAVAEAEPATAQPQPASATDEPAQDAPTPTQPKAPAVILADKDGVKVIQPAVSDQPDLQATVAIDAISYTDTGDVTVAGRGKPGMFVQLYLDTVSAGGAQIDPSGKWQAVLSAVAPGIYTLRADEVDETGKVLSRIETPFKRVAPELIAKTDNAATPSDQPAPPPVRVVTVQPGSTLWAIARDRYGEGLLYVRVFEANKDRIRDPDLIYPGQVFIVPE